MSWNSFIKKEKSKNYFKNIIELVKNDAKDHTIYPKSKDIFNAFKFCRLEKLKAVILGQDCYINENEAHGLAFSVPKNVKIPPSLKNIFKELKSDLNIDPPDRGCLESWAEQGVLLLNSILTVREGQSGSHSKFGWQEFSDNVIRFINDLNRPIVFIFWGNYAKSKSKLITNDKCLIIASSHPSPLAISHGDFFGSKPFSKTNNFLIKNNIEPISWEIK